MRITFCGQRFHRKALLASLLTCGIMALAFGGVAVLAAEHGLSLRAGTLRGDLITLVGSLAFALYTVVGKKVARLYDSVALNCFTGAAVACLLFGLKRLFKGLMGYFVVPLMVVRLFDSDILPHQKDVVFLLLRYFVHGFVDDEPLRVTEVEAVEYLLVEFLPIGPLQKYRVLRHYWY